MDKLPSTNLLLLSQRRGFGPHQDDIEIFSMTDQILQVKQGLGNFVAGEENKKLNRSIPFAQVLGRLTPSETHLAQAQSDQFSKSFSPVG